MSIDWSKRQNEVGRHQHLHSQILDPTTGAPVGGPQTLYTATVNLTDAKIKTLPTAPIDIVPAPGVGKIVRVIDSFITCDVSNGEYTGIDALAGLIIAWFSQEMIGIIDPAYFVNLLSSYDHTAATFAPNVPGMWSIGNTVNRKVYLKMANQAANFTGGHAANSMSVTVTYTLMDVTV